MSFRVSPLRSSSAIRSKPLASALSAGVSSARAFATSFSDGMAILSLLHTRRRRESLGLSGGNELPLMDLPSLLRLNNLPLGLLASGSDRAVRSDPEPCDAEPPSDLADIGVDDELGVAPASCAAWRLAAFAPTNGTPPPRPESLRGLRCNTSSRWAEAHDVWPDCREDKLLVVVCAG